MDYNQVKGRWSLISLNLLPKRYGLKCFTDKTIASSLSIVECLVSALQSVRNAQTIYPWKSKVLMANSHTSVVI